MQEIPECLNRRYKALDELIKELSEVEPTTNVDSNDDPSIKLLCDFWNILKDDPDVNLSQAVQQRMCLNTKNSGVFGSQQLSCYMAGCCKKNEEKKQDTINKIKNLCCKPSTESPGTAKCRSAKSTTPSTHSADLPLNKVLCNLKEAASFEKKCQTKINGLLETQKQLQEQIQTLEQKEKDGIQLLKQADCMWSCMEGAYKQKITESLERQKELLKQLKEVEESNAKWRKNKKDLEFQMDNVNKCQQEITEKINQKTSDIQCMDIEIENFKKRIDSNKKEIEETKKSFGNKKKNSAAKIANIAKEVTRLEKALQDELKYQKTKEEEGGKYVKEARSDLQQLCKVLLQKKLENEDMLAEKEALLLEIDLLNQTCDQCKDKCKNKEKSIDGEIRAIDKEIAEFKLKCIRCHECTDTVDVRKFCTDCPRCVNERDCLIQGDHCSPDHSMDCVCTTVKQKFLDNVFDNMYTLLERQVKTGPGKAAADAVLNCLKKSRNGKLNTETRKILQDFILTTVKKNLNLTIVGGAVKTRCEMDSETYKQLMLCLKQVQVVKPEKTDTGTEAMKEPCTRWGGRSECNCPKGPKECICTKKAPPALDEPTSCPPDQPKEKEDKGETILCPYKETTACGPDCALPSSVASEVASWRPSPCQGPTCQFKNMRAAQCVLGPEALSSISVPRVLQKASCKCEKSSTASCVCNNDIACRPRDRIIEEVIDTKQLKADKIIICNKDICENITKVEINERRYKVKQNKHKTKDNFNISTQKDEPNKNEVLVKNIKKNVLYASKDIEDKSRNDPGEIISRLHLNAIHSNEYLLPKNTFSKNVVTKKGESMPKCGLRSDDIINFEKPVKCDGQNKLDANIHKIDTKRRQENNNNTYKSNLYKIKLKGIKYDHKEPIFVVKRTSSGNFDVVLNKEFRKYNKKAIREYKGDESVQYATLMETSSGHFNLNFEEEKKSESKIGNALLMKSQSGNIKVLINKSQIDSIDPVTSKSVMTAENVGQLLNAYSSPHSSIQIKRKKFRKPHLLRMRSNSDSTLFEKQKVDVQNKQILNKKSSKVKDFICKAIATSCNTQNNDDSCDKDKCVCKNICYKSKQWFLKNSEFKKSETQRCYVNTEKIDDSFQNQISEFLEINKSYNNNCSCCSTKGKYCKDHYFLGKDSDFPYHIENNSLDSNEILYERYPLEVTMKENPTTIQWDSLDYLPPQLPSFLKEFEYSL